jgi:hypothetical protein
LEYIYIPKSVIEIYKEAFFNIPSEKLTIYYAGTEEDWEKIKIVETGNKAILHPKEINYLAHPIDLDSIPSTYSLHRPIPYGLFILEGSGVYDFEAPMTFREWLSSDYYSEDVTLTADGKLYSNGFIYTVDLDRYIIDCETIEPDKGE